MSSYLMPAAIAAVLMSTAGAAAQNEPVLLLQNGLANHAAIDMEGNGNRLEILQEHGGGLGANTVVATIRGDLNGGPLGAAFTGAALRSGLQPGALIQQGFGNAMAIEVNGTGNLFAFSQVGSGNSLRASITGYANQAAVVQTGVNNHAGFSQNGIGNSISIVQNSW